MKETFHINVAGLERDLPLCPLNDKLKIGAFVIFGDPVLTCESAKALVAKAPAHDVIITAESKGIPLAHEMARQLGEDRYILARKSVKLYMKDVVSTEVQSITTAAKQVLYLDGADAKFLKGKRVLIVDDVISTGESLNALKALVDNVGASVAGVMTIIAEGDAIGRKDITYLAELPLFDSEGEPLK